MIGSLRFTFIEFNDGSLNTSASVGPFCLMIHKAYCCYKLSEILLLIIWEIENSSSIEETLCGFYPWEFISVCL